MNKSKNINTSFKSKRKSRLNTVSVPAEIIIYIILGLFCLLCIVPFIFVVIISFTSMDSIREIGYSFWPKEWALDAYKYVIDLGDQLWRSYFNSFFITILGTILSVLMCILYSYALFRQDFKYRRFFSFFSFFTMMFGGGLAPTYVVCKTLLGLSDNYAALIVPMLVSPFNIIIMRTFFQSSVPDSLIEAAAIDGSGEYNTLFRIIIPIAKPGIATVGLLNALAYWNEWFIAMLYVRDAKYYPLQYLLMQMQNNVEFLVKNANILGVEAANIRANLPSDSLRMALVVLIVVPIACAYPFFQRYIISGLTIGSVKG
ncbi:carbohydrate ABC transporter permease [Clostridium sp. Marseille-P299]|uniref:carbohydrate ABC transporter permease n=1 Tax=Clostridium sp. Marseille-P299 TaxID=1805477 RepID=UPI0009ED7C5B|nr:carbohydrate ABC transporter permease [Clostridium sp. Marseille-P299]